MTPEDFAWLPRLQLVRVAHAPDSEAVTLHVVFAAGAPLGLTVVAKTVTSLPGPATCPVVTVASTATAAAATTAAADAELLPSLDGMLPADWLVDLQETDDPLSALLADLDLAAADGAALGLDPPRPPPPASAPPPPPAPRTRRWALLTLAPAKTAVAQRRAHAKFITHTLARRVLPNAAGFFLASRVLDAE